MAMHGMPRQPKGRHWRMKRRLPDVDSGARLAEGNARRLTRRRRPHEVMFTSIVTTHRRE